MKLYGLSSILRAYLSIGLLMLPFACGLLALVVFIVVVLTGGGF